jgi:tripartite-type tricarboxylate transporter receptor subunit TctC
VFAPAGTPPATLQKIHDAVNRAIEDPGIREKLASQGLEVQAMSREEFAAIVQSDLGKWSRIIAKLGIHAD